MLLVLNSKGKLVCLNCNIEFNQYDINWICMICNKEFNSEAKVYDPFIFKVIKITVKKTLFKGIEAKPPFVPCCKISVEQINNYKFLHKKECNGILNYNYYNIRSDLLRVRGTYYRRCVLLFVFWYNELKNWNRQKLNIWNVLTQKLLN